MKKTITNIVNMIRTVFNYSTDNPTPTSGITAFATAKTAVGNKLVLIDSLTQIVDGTTHGVTLDTNLIRSAMSNIAFKCGSAVKAYAASVNNNTLRLKVDYTLYKLSRFKKEEIDDICQQIHDAANTNIAAAGAFGYVAADVTDLQTAIDLYRTSVQNPRQAIITKKQAVVNIRLLTREIVDNLFKLQMDSMVNTLLATQADFVRGYFFAREIINIGVVHTKLNIFVKDVGGAGIQGATVSLLQNNIVAYFANSPANGKILITKIKPGTFNLRTEKTGFITKLETGVQFKSGKKVNRSVTLIAGVTPPANLTIVRQGNLGMTVATPIDLTGINATADTHVIFETDISPVRIYAAANPTDLPAAVYYDVVQGTPLNKLATLMAAELGLDDTKPYLMIQNTGSLSTHWTATFDHLNP